MSTWFTDDSRAEKISIFKAGVILGDWNKGLNENLEQCINISMGNLIQIKWNRCSNVQGIILLTVFWEHLSYAHI